MEDFDQRLHWRSDAALVINERARSDLVFAAPHHAPLGVTSLPCPEHEDSDENAGFIAVSAAARVDCHSVVAVNAADRDPNKYPDTPYTAQITNWSPTLLVELHGHGARRARFDIEISCGSPDRSWLAQLFAAGLSRRMSEFAGLRQFTVRGDFSQIYFKARRTRTIAGASWHGLHIELPPALRKGTEAVPVPADGYLLSWLIAQEALDMLGVIEDRRRTETALNKR